MKSFSPEPPNVGDATARAIGYRMRDRAGYIFDDANWRYAFGGYKFEMATGRGQSRRCSFFLLPRDRGNQAMNAKIVGEGSTSPWTALDSKGRPLDGGRDYKLRLPPDVPVKTFWSVILYNTQTHSMQQSNERFPSVSSQTKSARRMRTGPIDVYFGRSPAGRSIELG